MIESWFLRITQILVFIGTEAASTIVAFAMLYPIAWWLKENHFIANWLRSVFY